MPLHLRFFSSPVRDWIDGDRFQAGLIDVYDALKADASMEQRSLTQQAIVTLRQAQQQRRSCRRSKKVKALQDSLRCFDFDDQKQGGAGRV